MSHCFATLYYTVAVPDSLFVSCPLIGQSKTKRTFSQGTFLKDEPLDLGGKVIWIFLFFVQSSVLGFGALMD